MGNCHSMFSKDQNLIYDILQSYISYNTGWRKKDLDLVCKRNYAAIRNYYGKFLDEESLQTGKW